jgi:hypothetical protein
MKKTLLVSLVALGSLAFAAGSTFKVNLDQDSVVAGKSLKAGTYKISVENGNAVLTHGKESIEVPAKEETAPNRYSDTALTYSGNANLEEIDLGGTHTKIVFEATAPTHEGQ